MEKALGREGISQGKHLRPTDTHTLSDSQRHKVEKFRQIEKQEKALFHHLTYVEKNKMADLMAPKRKDTTLVSPQNTKLSFLQNCLKPDEALKSLPHLLQCNLNI